MLSKTLRVNLCSVQGVGSKNSLCLYKIPSLNFLVKDVFK